MRWGLSGAAIVVALYFLGFWVYYRVTEGCTHPADWFFHLDADAQATWLAAIAGVAVVMTTRQAINAALAVPDKEAALRKRETDALNRVRAHAISARLFYSLSLLSQRIQQVQNSLKLISGSRDRSTIEGELSDLHIVGPDVLLTAFQSPELFSQPRLERLVTLVTSIEAFNSIAADRYAHVKGWNDTGWLMFTDNGRLGMAGIMSRPINAAKRLEEASNALQMEVLTMVEETKGPTHAQQPS